MVKLHLENDLHKLKENVSGRCIHHNFFLNQVMRRRWLVVLDLNWQFLFPLLYFFVVSAAAVINCLTLLNWPCVLQAPVYFCASVTVRQRFRRHCAPGYNFRKRGVKSVFIGNAFSGVLTHILCSLRHCLPQLEVIRARAITWCASGGNHFIIIIFINTVLHACALRFDMSSNR